MTLSLMLGVAIAGASIWGAAYLLSLWHEDQRELTSLGRFRGWRTWTFARTLAYVAIACTLASNYLIVPTALRVYGFPNFRELQAALTPLTISAIVVLDVAFVVIAIYLRLIRRRGGHVLPDDSLTVGKHE